MLFSMPHRKPRIDDIPLDAVLAALGDPVRLRMVKMLASCPKNTPMNCATAAKHTCDLAPSTRTHHLRILREAGIIESSRQGVQVLNKLRMDEMDVRFPGLLKLVLKLTE